MQLSFNEIERLDNSTITFPLKLSESEIKVTPNIQDVVEALVYVKALKVSPMAYMLTVTLSLKCKILDDHDFKVKNFEDESSDEFMISKDSDIEEDVTPLENGLYDFRAIGLALYYSIVPTSYSTTKLSKKVIEGVEVISEDEYKKTHGNAFSNIDTSEFED